MMERIPSNIYHKVIGSFEYHQDKVLGKGSNSIVYRGKRIGTNQPVCIKKVAIRSPTIERLVKTEIEVLKRISHKNILSFITHIERASYIYIVTELCDMNLQQKIKKQGSFAEKEGLQTFLQILQGYQQLRNHGYIHRDIKPQNLLIIGDFIRSADFGYATVLKGQSLRETFNIGTPLYMAPQALNSNIYSQKSDIWSLGVTLYQMMSGKNPFVSKQQLLLKRQFKRPIKQLNCNPKLMKLIRKCIQYDTTKRYNLQQLVLDTKLLLNQLINTQKSTSQANVKIYQNEINYIEFMQYIILLAEECANLDQNLKERCIFIMKHSIRMRLDLVTKLFISGEQNSKTSKFKQSYLRFKQFHSLELRLPSRLASNDRLHFFKTQKITFQQSLQWQTQAQIKYLVKQINSQVRQLKNQHNILLQEYKVKLVDFLLTAFLLNKMGIQQANDFAKFARSAHLQVIMKSPSKVNLKAVQKIQAKAVLLQMI